MIAQTLVDGEQVIQILPEAVAVNGARARPPGQIAPEVGVLEQSLQAEPKLPVQLAGVQHDAGPAQGLTITAHVGGDARRLAGHRL